MCLERPDAPTRRPGKQLASSRFRVPSDKAMPFEMALLRYLGEKVDRQFWM